MKTIFNNLKPLFLFLHQFFSFFKSLKQVFLTISFILIYFFCSQNQCSSTSRLGFPANKAFCKKKRKLLIIFCKLFAKFIIFSRKGIKQKMQRWSQMFTKKYVYFFWQNFSHYFFHKIFAFSISRNFFISYFAKVFQFFAK